MYNANSFIFLLLQGKNVNKTMENFREKSEGASLETLCEKKLDTPAKKFNLE